MNARYTVEVIQTVCDLAQINNSPVTLAAAIQECSRELHIREMCYGKWVDAGKLTKFEAEERRTRLEAVRTFLQKLLDTEAEVRKHLPA